MSTRFRYLFQFNDRRGPVQFQWSTYSKLITAAPVFKLQLIHDYNIMQLSVFPFHKQWRTAKHVGVQNSWSAATGTVEICQEFVRQERGRATCSQQLVGLCKLWSLLRGVCVKNKHYNRSTCHYYYVRVEKIRDIVLLC